MSDTGSDADDSTALLLAHGRNERATAKKIPAEIDVDRAVPIFFGDRHDGSLDINSRVINEDIGPSESFEGLPGEPVDGDFTRDIASDSQRFAAECLDFVCDSCRLFALYIRHDDIRAFGREPERDRPANS